MKKLVIVLAFLIGSVANAAATCTGPAVMHDFPGTAFNMSLATNAGDGNCASVMALPSGAVASGSYSSGAFASGSYASGSIASGAMVDLGAQADSAAAGDTSTASLIALLKRNNQNLTTLNTTAGSSIPAGTNLIGKVGIDQTTPGTTNLVALAANQSVNTAQVNGVPTLTGTGATGTGAQRVTVATDQATNAGAALVKGGVGVVNGGSTYQTVAASATATVLQSSTGATGDYLSHCVIYPGTTGAGLVQVFDSTNSAANLVINFATGTLPGLAPIPVPVGAVSVNGAWKVTTGTNVTVSCFGKFS